MKAESRIDPNRGQASNSRLVVEWNDNHPIGTKVEATLDDRSIKETVTTSEAWLLGGHTAVVKLEGIAGCYSLRRVRAI